jgi:hypothetical protein
MRKIILLVLALIIFSSTVSSDEIPAVDLVDEYNLYNTNKILITVYDDGRDKTVGTITGQQEVAQMMRSLESAKPLAVFKTIPDYYLKFYSEDEFIFGFAYNSEDKQLYLSHAVYEPSADFISLIAPYICQ